jgi:hypothetical protein
VWGPLPLSTSPSLLCDTNMSVPFLLLQRREDNPSIKSPWLKIKKESREEEHPINHKRSRVEPSPPVIVIDGDDDDQPASSPPAIVAPPSTPTPTPFAAATTSTTTSTTTTTTSSGLVVIDEGLLSGVEHPNNAETASDFLWWYNGKGMVKVVGSKRSSKSAEVFLKKYYICPNQKVTKCNATKEVHLLPDGDRIAFQGAHNHLPPPKPRICPEVKE